MEAAQRAELIAGIKKAIAEQVGDPAKLKETLETLAGRLLALEQRAVADGPSHVRALGIPDPFAAESFTSRVKAVVDGQQNSGRILMPGVNLSNVTRLKSVLVSGAGNDSPNNVFPTVAQRGPIVPPVRRPLTLLDVLPRLPVGSNKFEHVRIVRTSAAAVVAEGAQKPETSFETTLETASIATIAHWTQASRQVLSDNAQLTNILSGILSFDVVAKYEDLIVNGNGTTDEIEGLLALADVFSASATPKPDRISECAATMWSEGFIASVTIMNPLDWHEIRTERADSGDGQYVASPGWAGNSVAPTIWEIPLVQTPSVAQGTAIVVDGRYVTLLDREQAQTMISTEDRDNFVKNLVTLLAEMRAGLAVYDTGAVRSVDIGST